jgi:dethiobiotin synthetase
VSAVLTEAFNADYWKPIQTGSETDSDEKTVKNMVANSVTTIHPTLIKYKLPASPNIASNAEGATIDLNDIVFPSTSKTLIIEGAGGIMVPINSQHTFIDFIIKNKLEVILVVNDYLGCINHTLLSLEVLKTHQIKIAFIVFNGHFDKAVKYTILKFTDIPFIDVPNFEKLEAKEIEKVANTKRNELQGYR